MDQLSDLIFYLIAFLPSSVHLSIRFDHQSINDQHFDLWLNLRHAVRGEVAFHMKLLSAWVCCLYAWECADYRISCRLSLNVGYILWALPICEHQDSCYPVINMKLMWIVFWCMFQWSWSLSVLTCQQLFWYSGPTIGSYCTQQTSVILCESVWVWADFTSVHQKWSKTVTLVSQL